MPSRGEFEREKCATESQRKHRSQERLFLRRPPAQEPVRQFYAER